MGWLDLFAGGGGAALGLQRAGVVASHVELASAECATLRAAGFGVVHEADVADVEAYAGGSPFDGVWASPPCQPFSTAGDQLVAEDPRNGFPALFKALRRFRLPVVLIENVGGLLEHSGKCVRKDPNACSRCYLDRVILPTLQELYPCVSWRKLDAADYGVPQTRKRVFIHAGPTPMRWPAATHAEPSRAALLGRLPWVSIADALSLDLDTLQAERTTTDPLWRHRASDVGGPSRAVGTRRNASIAWLMQPSPAIPTTEVKGTRASAASGGEWNGGADRLSDVLYATIGRRRATVAECAIIQGFPPDHPFQGTVTEQYRQVGNACPPAMVEALVRSLHGSHQ